MVMISVSWILRARRAHCLMQSRCSWARTVHDIKSVVCSKAKSPGESWYHIRDEWFFCRKCCLPLRWPEYRDGSKLKPIEVKSSNYKSHVSIDRFCMKYSNRVERKYIVYTKDFKKEGNTLYIPVYMTMFLWESAGQRARSLTLVLVQNCLLKVQGTGHCPEPKPLIFKIFNFLIFNFSWYRGQATVPQEYSKI